MIAMESALSTKPTNSSFSNISKVTKTTAHSRAVSALDGVIDAQNRSMFCEQSL